MVQTGASCHRTEAVFLLCRVQQDDFPEPEEEGGKVCSFTSSEQVKMETTETSERNAAVTSEKTAATVTSKRDDVLVVARHPGSETATRTRLKFVGTVTEQADLLGLTSRTGEYYHLHKSSRGKTKLTSWISAPNKAKGSHDWSAKFPVSSPRNQEEKDQKFQEPGDIQRSATCHDLPGTEKQKHSCAEKQIILENSAKRRKKMNKAVVPVQGATGTEHGDTKNRFQILPDQPDAERDVKFNPAMSPSSLSTAGSCLKREPSSMNQVSTPNIKHLPLKKRKSVKEGTVFVSEDIYEALSPLPPQLPVSPDLKYEGKSPPGFQTIVKRERSPRKRNASGAVVSNVKMKSSSNVCDNSKSPQKAKCETAVLEAESQKPTGCLFEWVRDKDRNTAGFSRQAQHELTRSDCGNRRVTKQEMEEEESQNSNRSTDRHLYVHKGKLSPCSFVVARQVSREKKRRKIDVDLWDGGDNPCSSAEMSNHEIDIDVEQYIRTQEEVKKLKKELWEFQQESKWRKTQEHIVVLCTCTQNSVCFTDRKNNVFCLSVLFI